MDDTLPQDINTMPTYEEFLENARKNFRSKSIDDLINSLKKQLSHYEQKYQMESKTFVIRFENGEFENLDNFPDHDLFRWWSHYKSYQKLSRKRKANGSS